MIDRIMAWLLAEVGSARGGRQRWFTAGMLWLMISGPLAAWRLPWFFFQSDVEWYLKLATGDGTVMQPFASRQLAPLLVRHLVAWSGLPVASAFIALGWVAYVVFAASVLAIVIQDAMPRWVVLLVLGLAFWGFSFNALAFPDLLFAALTGLFLLMLWKRQDALAALMLLPMTLSREATLLTLGCLLLAAWRRMRWRYLALAAAAMALGSALVKHMAAHALSNAQDLPPALYMLGKLPWNLVRNVFGVDPFTNLAPCAARPIWQHSFHLRGIEVIGLCARDTMSTLMTLRSMTACLGTLPVLLLFVWKRRLLRFGAQSVLLRFCLIYGVVSFVLAPGLGTAVDRLVRYAWPAFLIALPLLLSTQPTARLDAEPESKKEQIGDPDATGTRMGLRPGTVVALLALNTAASWSEFTFYTWHSVFVSVPSMLAAWLLLQRNFRGDGDTASAGDTQLASAA